MAPSDSLEANAVPLHCALGPLHLHHGDDAGARGSRSTACRRCGGRDAAAETREKERAAASAGECGGGEAAAAAGRGGVDGRARLRMGSSGADDSAPLGLILRSLGGMTEDVARRFSGQTEVASMDDNEACELNGCRWSHGGAVDAASPEVAVAVAVRTPSAMALLAARCTSGSWWSESGVETMGASGTWSSQAESAKSRLAEAPHRASMAASCARGLLDAVELSWNLVRAAGRFDDDGVAVTEEVINWLVVAVFFSMACWLVLAAATTGARASARTSSASPLATAARHHHRRQ
uniref:Uncharacterized protein n=1 Tax=Oryza barthii TaxID=65489 RepID=A0A0D3HSP8_9ORYZ